MKFVDRGHELKRLRSLQDGGEPFLAVLYGRRRCGKSTLLQKALGGKDVYYLASQEDAVIQRDALAREIARTQARFDEVQYPSWATLIDALHERASGGVHLILDEFPYLVQTSPELPSVIQRYWDAPGTKRISFVLCGSSQRMMQGIVLDHAAPLYGRAREIMRIAPLSAGWISEALNLNPRESVRAYAIWGGVPRYWELAEPHKTTDAAVAHVLLDRHGVLFDEPMRLLLDDMRGSVQAVSLLTLIGYGGHRLSEIAGRLGKPAGSLVRPLSQLIELGYVRRELPFGETARSTKRTLYKLADPFLRYYFRFVEPQRSRIEMGLGDQVAKEIKEHESGHVASVWEDLARESVPHLEIGGLRWKPASRWWGAGSGRRSMELDVVAEAVDGSAVLIGEAKWGETAGKRGCIHEHLVDRAACCPVVRGRPIVTALWLGNQKTHSSPGKIFTEAETLNALRT